MPAPREVRRQQQRTRSLLTALARTALEEAGERLGTARQAERRELETIGQHVPTALRAGLSVSEIAEITGLTRQKVYELRDAQAVPADDLELPVLSQLAAADGHSPDQLARAIGATADAVAHTLGDLEDRGLIRTALTQYAPDAPETWILITPAGEARLQELLGTREPLERMAVFVAFDPAERAAIEQGARSALGGVRYTIVEAGVAQAIELPEIAFHLLAAGPQDAVTQARDRMEEIRRAGALEPRAPAQIVVYPTPM